MFVACRPGRFLVGSTVASLPVRCLATKVFPFLWVLPSQESRRERMCESVSSCLLVGVQKQDHGLPSGRPRTSEASWFTRGLATPIPPRLLAIYFFAWGGSPQRGVIIPWMLELMILAIYLFCLGRFPAAWNNYSMEA